MAGVSITVPTGADVIINTAPWKDAKVLKRVVEREIALAGGNFDLTTFLMVDSSEALEAALAPCLARCLYNGAKINDMVFDTKEAREDLPDITLACLKENLGPLVLRLLSMLKEHGILIRQAKPEEGQKSP